MLNALSERSPAEELIEAHRARASRQDFAYLRFRATLLTGEWRSSEWDWHAVVGCAVGCAIAAVVCAMLIL